MIPEISASFERAMYISNTFPISVGGYTNIYGVKYFTQNPPSTAVNVEPSEKGFPAQYVFFNIGTLVKYHLDLEIDNLDFYTGAKLGVNFASNMGATFETGFPGFLNVQFNYKL